ncbi:5-formyltetrahydrofolate cyclo-ligase [Candidatus Micrarchaeota archaeon]|nr:5-formyltetrahydrofolate cyclo-ligase [Candidatus Micrarchaeota archaeon]
MYSRDTMVTHMKNALRKEILAERDGLRETQILSMSLIIKEKLFSTEHFQKAKTVCFYLAKGSEVSTKNMIESALSLGKHVVVPVTGEKIEFVHFTSFEDLRRGRFGVPEPSTLKPHSEEPDLIVVPGIAFDLHLHRLGYGKGYYDKYLATSGAYRVGICYDFQVVPVLPRHEQDVPMDEVITEKRIIGKNEKNPAKDKD